MRLFSLVALLATTAVSSGIRLGVPTYNGSGCPQGSASAALSPDYTALSILFDTYSSSAGGQTGKTMERKTCNIAVPVIVPQGKSVSLFTIDYRGFNSIPHGAYATFTAEYFFAGRTGPRFEKRWDGSVEDEYTLRHFLPADVTVWSPCGESVILRANTASFSRTNDYGDEVYSAVDTADINAGLIYHLRWMDC